MEPQFKTGDIVASKHRTILVIKVRKDTFSGIVLAADDKVDKAGKYFKTWNIDAFKLLNLKLTDLITHGQSPIKEPIIPSQCQGK